MISAWNGAEKMCHSFSELGTYRRDSGSDGWILDGKNRLERSVGVATRNHFYDAAGNLTQVGFLPGGVTPLWEWSYDALGMQQRFKWNQPGGVLKDFIYLYGPGNLRLLEFDGTTGIRTMTYRDLDGSILREYDVLGFGLNTGGASEVWTHTKDFLQGPQGLIATRTHTAGHRFFFADHLGTPRVLTNGYGQVASRHDYYPYGAEVVASADDERHYKYTGHQRDTHGLTDYMLGRTCAFPLMRFMSVDPGRDGWNMYAYVGGNPVNAVDPSGNTVSFAALDEDQRQELLQRLNEFTGNEYAVDDQGNLVLSKTGDDSSATATKFLNEAIASETTIPIVAGETGNRYNKATGQIEINFSSFEEARPGKVDARSLSLGTALVHELHHAFTGSVDFTGPHRDGFDWTGGTVDFVNSIRQERGLPRRAAYNAEASGRWLIFRFDHVSNKHPDRIFKFRRRRW